MTADHPLEARARSLLEQEWASFRRRLRGQRAKHAPCDCPAEWFLPELLDSVAEHRDQPVEWIRSDIRRLLDGLHFVNENGDSIMEEEGENLIEAQVDLVLKVLERVRKDALAQGFWSTAPVTPIMFG